MYILSPRKWLNIITKASAVLLGYFANYKMEIFSFIDNFAVYRYVHITLWPYFEVWNMS